MSGNLKGIVRQAAVSCDESIVTIELICSDAYAARVLYDDIRSRAKSNGGMRLSLRGRLCPETETPA